MAFSETALVAPRQHFINRTRRQTAISRPLRDGNAFKGDFPTEFFRCLQVLFAHFGPLFLRPRAVPCRGYLVGGYR